MGRSSGAKVAGLGLVLAVCVGLSVVVGWVYTAILFEPLPVGGWIAFALLAWLGLAAWAAITFLASTVTGSTAAAAGIGFGALLVLSLLAAIPNAGPIPAGRTGRAGRRAWPPGAPVAVGDVLVPVISTIVLIAIALGAAAWSFRRQEL